MIAPEIFNRAAVTTGQAILTPAKGMESSVISSPTGRGNSARQSPPGSWGWRPNRPVKSLVDCIHLLVNTAGRDGNLLLNIGPKADGEIEPLQVARLKEIGDWLGKYGQSIYATRGRSLQTCR